MELSSPTDIAIVSKMYSAAPTLGDTSAGQPIREHMRELDMTMDRHRFTEDPGDLPVYEGRMVDAFDHRAKAYHSGRGRAARWDDLEFGSAGKSIRPQWHIDAGNLPDKLGDRIRRPRVGYCKVTSSSNERTLLASLIPPDTVCGNSVATIAFPRPFEWAYMVWLSVANSFVVDWLVRKMVSLNMTNTVLDSLPFPRLSADSFAARFLVPRAALLTCISSEMHCYWNALAYQGFVDQCGQDTVVPGEVDPFRRAILRAEIDAFVARSLFGLDSSQIDYIMETFPIVRKNDEKAHGEYRTKRVILEIYDQMAEAARTGRPYQTRLDPPPADPKVAHPPRDKQAEGAS